MSTTHAQALRWLDATLLPATRGHAQFAVSVYCHEPNRDAGGAVVDLPSFTGKVRQLSEDWILLKQGRHQFFVCARRLAESTPEVGATVCLTPYARRRFDGARCDEPPHTAAPRKHWRADYRSPVPAHPAVRACRALDELLERLETTVAPDGIRTLAHLLIDAGAHEVPPVFGNFTASDQPPRVTFRTRSQCLIRYLRIECLPADEYRLGLYTDELPFWHTCPFPAQALAEQLSKVIGGNNRWRQAHINVLRSANFRRFRGLLRAG